MTTKICQLCGGDCMIPLRSLNLKICNDCKKETPWDLEPGQKSLVAPSRADRKPEPAADGV